MRTKQNINYNQQTKGNLQTSGKLISSQTKHATRPLLRENELEPGMDGLEDSKRFHNQISNIKANIVTNIVDGAMQGAYTKEEQYNSLEAMQHLLDLSKVHGGVGTFQVSNQKLNMLAEDS